MACRSVVGVHLVVITSVLLSGTLWAQQAGSIAGVVKDTSGGGAARRHRGSRQSRA